MISFILALIFVSIFTIVAFAISPILGVLSLFIFTLSIVLVVSANRKKK